MVAASATDGPRQLGLDDAMTSNTQKNDNRILTDAELNGVSGGAGNFFTDAASKPRTNGDNPFVQVVSLAERKAFYRDSWGQCAGIPAA
jgi:hypothetical protein